MDFVELCTEGKSNKAIALFDACDVLIKRCLVRKSTGCFFKRTFEKVRIARRILYDRDVRDMYEERMVLAVFCGDVDAVKNIDRHLKDDNVFFTHRRMTNDAGTHILDMCLLDVIAENRDVPMATLLMGRGANLVSYPPKNEENFIIANNIGIGEGWKRPAQVLMEFMMESEYDPTLLLLSLDEIPLEATYEVMLWLLGEGKYESAYAIYVKCGYQRSRLKWELPRLSDTSLLSIRLDEVRKRAQDTIRIVRGAILDKCQRCTNDGRWIKIVRRILESYLSDTTHYPITTFHPLVDYR